MKERRVSLRTRVINRDANGADTLRKIRARARARGGGNRALPSTRLTFPMIVIGSTAKSEGINYPCGFPIPPPIRAGLNEDESGRIPGAEAREKRALSF